MAAAAGEGECSIPLPHRVGAQLTHRHQGRRQYLVHATAAHPGRRAGQRGGGAREVWRRRGSRCGWIPSQATTRWAWRQPICSHRGDGLATNPVEARCGLLFSCDAITNLCR